MLLCVETIDYGPYGFMERFDPNFTPNTSDLDGAPTLLPTRQEWIHPHHLSHRDYTRTRGQQQH